MPLRTPHVTLTVDIAPALGERIRAAAKRAGLNMSEWVRLELEKALSHEEEEDKESQGRGTPSTAD